MKKRGKESLEPKTISRATSDLGVVTSQAGNQALTDEEKGGEPKAKRAKASSSFPCPPQVTSLFPVPRESDVSADFWSLVFGKESQIETEVLIDQQRALSGADITRKHLFCLQDGNDLNDEVVNLSFKQIEHQTLSRGSVKVKVLISFFHGKLWQDKARESGDDGYSYVPRCGTTGKHLKDWPGCPSLFDMDLVLIPYHDTLGMKLGTGGHWSLSVIDFKEKKITYIDPAGVSDHLLCSTILSYPLN